MADRWSGRSLGLGADGHGWNNDDRWRAQRDAAATIMDRTEVRFSALVSGSARPSGKSLPQLDEEAKAALDHLEAELAIASVPHTREQWADRSVKVYEALWKLLEERGRSAFSPRHFGALPCYERDLPGEWVCSSASTIVSALEGSPLFHRLEALVDGWIKGILPWPGGELMMQPNGDYAAALFLALARSAEQRGVSRHARDVAVFASGGAPLTIEAARVGLEAEQIFTVPVDRVGRMRPEALAAQMDEARHMGLVPAFVRASAGGPSGAVDDVVAIARVVAQAAKDADAPRAWLDVRGEGVFSMLTCSWGRREFADADSVGMPLYPYGLGSRLDYLCLRDPEALKAYNPGEASAYLFHDEVKGTTGADSETDAPSVTEPEPKSLGPLSPWCSREEHKGAALMALVNGGQDGLRVHGMGALECAHLLVRELNAAPEIEVAPHSLVQRLGAPVVCFRPAPRLGIDADILLSRLARGGYVFEKVVLEGQDGPPQTYLRANTGRRKLTLQDIRDAAADIARAARAETVSEPPPAKATEDRRAAQIGFKQVARFLKSGWDDPEGPVFGASCPAEAMGPLRLLRQNYTAGGEERPAPAAELHELVRLSRVHGTKWDENNNNQVGSPPSADVVPLTLSAVSVGEASLLREVEHRVCRDLSGRLGYDPEQARGLFLQSGTLANNDAMALALMAMLRLNGSKRPERSKLVCFANELAHYSTLRRGPDRLGIGHVVRVEADPATQRMRPEALAYALDEAWKQGLHPFFVTATMGTTVCGAFDPLQEIREVIDRHAALHDIPPAWLHADLAHGGAWGLADGSALGVPLADSVMLDNHKNGTGTVVSSALFCRNGEHLEPLLSHRPEPGMYAGGELPYAKAVPVYHWMLAQGADGFAAHAGRATEQARAFAQDIDNSAIFEMALQPETSMPCFRLKPLPDATTDEWNARMVELRELINAPGEHMLNLIEINGKKYLRVNFIQPGKGDAARAKVFNYVTRVAKPFYRKLARQAGNDDGLAAAVS